MRRPRSSLLAVLAVAVVGIVLVGCGDDTASTSAPSVTTTTVAAGPTLLGEVTVFAASSLTESFTELGKQFEAAHPGVEVTLNFGASSALVQQITGGAPVDVFASADESNMKKLTDAGLGAGAATVFARNQLEILVEAGNPKSITGLADLAEPDLAVVLCAESVPCGKLAKQILDAAHVAVTAKSLEENVKGVVTKVTLGEADAGIVYVTDVLAAKDRAAGVEIPDDQNAVTKYPIVVTKAAANPDAAAAFEAFVTSSDGQVVLKGYGFDTP